MVAIGDGTRLRGYGLAGAEVRSAAGDEDVLAAWETLPQDVAFVVLTPAARAALGARLTERRDLLWAVVPD